jgi:copper/silver efflux system protein
VLRIEARLQSLSKLRWNEFIAAENQLLYARVGRAWTQIVVNELCERTVLTDPSFADVWDQVLAARYSASRLALEHHQAGHAGLPSYSKLPTIDPHPVYDGLMKKLSQRLSNEVWLWPHDSESLAGAMGELDSAVQMPGWANVWTRPIQNRIDMLATGVNSELGVRVLGNDFKKVVNASEQVAEILQQIPGAANVLCDPIRDKDYVDVSYNQSLIEERGLNHEEVRLAVETVIRGKVIDIQAINSSDVAKTIPVRLMTQTTQSGMDLLHGSIPLIVNAKSIDNMPQVKLQVLHEVSSMEHRDGPATIKSENGLLRNYVRLNVRERNVDEWLRDAKQAIANASLPDGITLEWTGQFEHAARTRAAMQWIIPICVLIIGSLLYFVFRDAADALLMLLSVPGALAGAVVCQWLLGFPFSLAVGVGYIACFGMAAATSMVMLVYLRQALNDAGGLEGLTLDQLKTTVIEGAVQRLRPKLLTEATMILGLAPMMWSHGIGADVIRPMAAPVLGGILIADEVVDLLIPVLFFFIRRHRWLRIHQVAPEVNS